MEITVRVEVQYLAPEHAVLLDVLQMFRRPMWVRFMMRYISPRLKSASPADKTVLDCLERDWRVPSSSACGGDETQPQTSDCSASASHTPPLSGDCVICMADTPRPSIEHVRLPCGHGFHFHCVQSWLQMSSTCPVCRFQFPKAFAGTYAVHSLTSTVLLTEDQRALSHEELLHASVEKQLVRAIVNVTLVKVLSEEKKKEYPCELSALVMHADGEVFSEYDVIPGTGENKATEPSSDRVTGSVRARAACDLHSDDFDGDQHMNGKRLRRA
jgi:hypothetical protein